MTSCLKPKNDKQTKSDSINKKLKEKKRQYRLTHRIPVVGAGESGKSTLIKQMQILYINGFSKEDRLAKVPDIHRNVSDAMLSITGAMHQISPPVSLEHSENQELVEWVQSDLIKPTIDYTPQFFENVRRLWADKGVIATFNRSHEYQLIDSAKYFLDKLDEVSNEDYSPSDQDILRCRVLTSGIFETKFQMGKIQFHMFDVGGQREERKKWIQVFHDITAVIFVSASSGYDMTLRENPTQNRLRESIDLFKEVWNNRFLRNNSIILFLNKQDLFSQKIKKGLAGNGTKLATFFPEFNDYPAPKLETELSKEDQEVERAKYFIRDQFLAVSVSGDGQRRCYPHFTTAVDTENIKRVFGDCQDMLQRLYMQKMGFI